MTAGSPIAGEPLGSTGAGIASSSGNTDVGAVVSGFFGRMRAMATRLLTKRNTGTVLLVRKTSTDNDDPMANSIGTTEIARKALVTGFSSKEIDGARILASDRKVLMNADSLSQKPAAIDELLIDAERHTIVDVRPIPAAGDAVVYIVQARSLGQG